MRLTEGFTLIEVLVGVIILGILVSLSFVHYGRVMESSFNREAQSTLRLLQAAQKIYYVDWNTYYPPSGNDSNISNINANLRVSIPDVASPHWNYTVYDDGCSEARRPTDSRYWHIERNDSTYDTGQCP